MLAMLAAEGLAPHEMWVGKPGHQTHVVERDGEMAGFFTIRMAHGMPFVIHLCGARRRPTDALRLARALKRALAGMGAKRAILNLRVGCGKLIAVTERVMKAKRYAEEDGLIFFVMEVGHG